MNTTTTDTSTHQDVDEHLEERSYGAYWFLFLISLVLLCFVPSQATWVSTTHGWFTQPMLGSLLGLSILCLFSLFRVIQSLKDFSNTPIGRGENTVEAIFDALDGFRTALVASVLFFVYIKLLDVIGFMIATTAFTITLLWMSRLLNRTWFISALLTVTALIIIFRFVLHIWLPDVWLYSLLPDAMADFANQYL